MQHAVFRKILAVLLGLVLAATGLWASAAEEEEPAAAMEKEMVMDPATGKMVTAPEYGGTLTYPYIRTARNGAGRYHRAPPMRSGAGFGRFPTRGKP